MPSKKASSISPSSKIRTAPGPNIMGYPGGMTSLCTLALLNAGLEPADPQIQKALEYLRKIKPEMNYVIALQTMVFCRAEPEKDRLLHHAATSNGSKSTQVSKGRTQRLLVLSRRGRRQLERPIRLARPARSRARRRAGQAIRPGGSPESIGKIANNADGSWDYKSNDGRHRQHDAARASVRW